MTDPETLWASASPAQSPHETPFSALMRNAWWLSVLYLLAGIGVAGVRHFSGATLWLRVALTLDAFAHAVLEALGLWEPLLRAVATGGIRPWEVRLLLIAVTVALIFAQAIAVALFLGVLRWVWIRVAMLRS